jgi:hypothetical protein
MKARSAHLWVFTALVVGATLLPAPAAGETIGKPMVGSGRVVEAPWLLSSATEDDAG